LVEADLIPALASGQLSAAALDVFREEPLELCAEVGDGLMR
jgi:glyoxylate/hydroxypyruvate reductase A